MPPPPAADEADTRGTFKPSTRNVNWLYTTPMFLVALPLVRQIPYLKARPELRNRVFYGLVAVALAHGIWLLSRDNTDDPVRVAEQERYIPPPSNARHHR